MTAIEKRGARSSGPIGWCVPGWRTGGGGCDRSAAKLYQDVGIASSGKRKRVCSSIAVLLQFLARPPPAPDWQCDQTAPEANWLPARTCAHGTDGTAPRQQGHVAVIGLKRPLSGGTG